MNNVHKRAVHEEARERLRSREVIYPPTVTHLVEFLPQVEQRSELMRPDVLVELGALGVGSLEHAQLRDDGRAVHALRRAVDVLRQTEVRRLVELGQLLDRLQEVLRIRTQTQTTSTSCLLVTQLT